MKVTRMRENQGVQGDKLVGVGISDGQRAFRKRQVGLLETVRRVSPVSGKGHPGMT